MANARTPVDLYWFDTCSFTQLRRVYPRENFERVWELIETLATQGRIKSVEDVLLELQDQDDDVATWATGHSDLFVDLELPIQQQARAILARFPTLLSFRNARGSSSADPFLVACAIVYGGIIVTEEQRSGGPPRVKIPDVCEQLNIRCFKLLEVLRCEGLRT